jgi:hypothetical protein
MYVYIYISIRVKKGGDYRTHHAHIFHVLSVADI